MITEVNIVLLHGLYIITVKFPLIHNWMRTLTYFSRMKTDTKKTDYFW